MPPEPVLSTALNRNAAYVLVDMRSVKDVEQIFGGGRYLYTGLATRPDVIQGRPEIVQRVVNAVARGIKYLASSDGSELAKKLPADGLGGDPANWLAGFQRDKAWLSPDGRMESRDLANNVELLKTAGTITPERAVDFEKILNATYLQKAPAR